MLFYVFAFRTIKVTTSSYITCNNYTGI